jgi:hypothetical protein
MEVWSKGGEARGGGTNGLVVALGVVDSVVLLHGLLIVEDGIVTKGAPAAENNCKRPTLNAHLQEEEPGRSPLHGVSVGCCALLVSLWFCVLRCPNGLGNNNVWYAWNVLGLFGCVSHLGDLVGAVDDRFDQTSCKYACRLMHHANT